MIQSDCAGPCRVFNYRSDEGRVARPRDFLTVTYTGYVCKAAEADAQMVAAASPFGTKAKFSALPALVRPPADCRRSWRFALLITGRKQMLWSSRTFRSLSIHLFLQAAEVREAALPRQVFAGIVALINGLHGPPAAAVPA